MAEKRVLVLLPLEERHRRRLEAAGEGCCFEYSRPAEADGEMIRRANIIFGKAKPGLIGASENLEWLQLDSAGADAYVKPGILHEKTLLTNATGAYSTAVAEHAFALTLMLQKKLHLYRDDQKRALWGDRGMVTSLKGATVAVVGVGDIGLYYARLVKAMGAYVIGIKRRPSPLPEGVDELVLTDELDAVLPRADVIMSVLPGTPATDHIFTAERFDAMKDTALFINCGRGSAVAADVLCDALINHKIRAAAIDVAEKEPLPPDSPLWALEDLVITPHISGNYHLPETLERVVDIAEENLRAFLRGEPLRNMVDFSTGYKK